jgi:hypothetical protein
MSSESIDFDESSRMWRANKFRATGTSSFRYCCGFPKANGSFCKGIPLHWCRSHRIHDANFTRSPGPCRDHTHMKYSNAWSYNANTAP